MLNFESDYITGAHPEILKRMIETNLIPESGYGKDQFSLSAEKKILEACGLTGGDVFFISGGTQTNALIISTMCKQYEGVVAAVTGHVEAHEAGAVEYTGHKVLTIPGHEGKIDPAELKGFLQDFYADGNYMQMVFPGMVYISHPTEYGTLYTKKELQEISGICREYEIPLFLDGARLGYGLASFDTDVTLKDIAEYTDVFYIGGTKTGALVGEAVVFTKNNTPKYFTNLMKKHGALLAKGRLIGVQFDTLFTGNLFYEISRNAIEKAERLKKMFADRGYSFLLNSPTNQQFVILENSRMEELKENVKFSFWEKIDETHTAVRFATCWSTTDEDLDRLEALL